MRMNTQKRKPLLLVALVGIIFILVLGNVFSSQRRAIFFSLSVPLQKIVWQMGEIFSRKFHWSPSETLKEENRALWIENQSLKAKIIELQKLEEENNQLKEAFGMKAEKNFSLLPIHAIGISPFEDTLFIDQGIREGVKKGMPVISSQAVLYGFVEEVFEQSSRVRLLSHPESSLVVTIAESGVSGIVKGKGNGNAILDFVPRGTDLKEGSLVLTSFQENYPNGLLVGLTGQMLASDIEPFLQSRIQFFFEKANLYKEKELFLLKDF
jgi:rod shape-determining protein MreC